MNSIRKHGTRLVAVLAASLGLLAATAFAGSYFDSVSGSNGVENKSGYVYNVPAGALVEWAGYAAPVYSPDGQAGDWITGGGLDVYQYVGPGQNYDDGTTTTVSDNIGYQIWAAGSTSAYASWALISISW